MPPDKTRARALVNVPNESTLIVFFGQVRRYKNVPSLLEVFSKLVGTHFNLGIVGAPGAEESLKREIQHMAGRDSRVIPVLRHLSDDELAAWIAAADLIVLPLRDVSNSGSALLSLSMNRPVLVPNKGSMCELGDMVGNEWLRVYEGELTPKVLANAIEWSGMARTGCPDLGSYAWDAIAKATVATYQDSFVKVAR